MSMFNGLINTGTYDGLMVSSDAEIVEFPQWIQFHGHWRELPQFNEFADPDVSPEPTVSPTSAKHNDQLQGMNHRSIQSNSGAARKRKHLESEEVCAVKICSGSD